MQRLRISTAFSIDHQLRGCAFGAVDVEAGVRVRGGGSEYSNHFNLASWKPDPAALTAALMD